MLEPMLFLVPVLAVGDDDDDDKDDVGGMTEVILGFSGREGFPIEFLLLLGEFDESVTVVVVVCGNDDDDDEVSVYSHSISRERSSLSLSFN